MTNPYQSSGGPNEAPLRRNVLQHDELWLALCHRVFTGNDQRYVADCTARQAERIIQQLTPVARERVTGCTHGEFHIAQMIAG
ncbi:hypothetical protein D3C85_887410 [compost metagenome]